MKTYTYLFMLLFTCFIWLRPNAVDEGPPKTDTALFESIFHVSDDPGMSDQQYELLTATLDSRGTSSIPAFISRYFNLNSPINKYLPFKDNIPIYLGDGLKNKSLTPLLKAIITRIRGVDIGNITLDQNQLLINNILENESSG